ncbi:MAG TPA: hypothetical protein VFJ58_29805 [Armatimonadota bacterium]|nr:hypothetical protein [Armatimonadota bacterium]
MSFRVHGKSSSLGAITARQVVPGPVGYNSPESSGAAIGAGMAQEVQVGRAGFDGGSWRRNGSGRLRE